MKWTKIGKGIAMQNFFYSIVSGSGNFIFHTILLFWIFTAYSFTFFIARLSKEKQEVATFPFGLMFLIQLGFLLSFFLIDNPSTKLPPFEFALIAIDSLLFLLAWKIYLEDKKNLFQLTFIVLFLVVLGIVSVFLWERANLPYFSNLHTTSRWNLQKMWAFILAFALLVTVISSFKKNMPIYLMLFGSLLGGGLILHVTLNSWIASSNYSPFLRIAMLLAYPILLAYPFAQLILLSQRRKQAQAIQKKNKIYQPGIEIRENSFLDQPVNTQTQPNQADPSVIETIPNQKLDGFSITEFLDEFIQAKEIEFKSKQVQIEAFYQGLDFNVPVDRAEFKAAFEAFFSFLEIICDRDYQVNIALGNLNNRNIIQIDIIADPEKITELNEQLFIAGQRFDELGIQNEYIQEDQNLIRMQMAL